MKETSIVTISFNHDRAGRIHSPSFKGSRTGTEIVDPPEMRGENTKRSFTRLNLLVMVDERVMIMTHDGKDSDQSIVVATMITATMMVNTRDFQTGTMRRLWYPYIPSGTNTAIPTSIKLPGT